MEYRHEPCENLENGILAKKTSVFTIITAINRDEVKHNNPICCT